MYTEEMDNLQDMKIFNNAMLYGPSDSDFAQDLRSSFKSDLFNSNRMHNRIQQIPPTQQILILDKPDFTETQGSLIVVGPEHLRMSAPTIKYDEVRK